MTVYNLTLTTLTPLHIGDGNELRQDFDFVVKGGRTYRLDEDKVLHAKEDQLVPNQAGKYPLPGKLLSGADFNNPALFRYILAGAPRSSKADARMKTYIKDIHDRPYIPGSSLKGAIRTALAWHGWKEVKPNLDRNAIGRRKSWAGQPLERKIFGPDPNHDLLRALQVSDLFGPDEAGESLVIANAQVLTKRSSGSPVELEALKGDISLRGTITIDETLFQPEMERQLKFANRKHWLDELCARVQAHSLARIDELIKWFEDAENGAQIARFYRQLSRADLTPDQALLQLGWGSGWDSKTFWTHLQQDIYLFEKLVDEFKMHKQQRDAPPRKPGDPFPRSKRAAMTIRDGKPYPLAPFGWVLMELNKRGT
jgi:CRISPR-associated protein Csm5